MTRDAPTSQRKCALCAVCVAVACLQALPALGQTAHCAPGSQHPKVTVAAGIETVEIGAGSTAMRIRLLRLATSHWAIRVVDMRDMRNLKSRRSDYTAPTYSLDELATLRAPDRVLSSAGLTESLSAPVPVGLLKVDGVVRSLANTSSRVLDGVLCVRGDQDVKLLSVVTSLGRRIPPDAPIATRACTHALQAGPMLVEEGKPLIVTPLRFDVSRVFAAIDRQGRFVLGHADKATTFELACVLVAPALSIDAAIGLQSDELGGVILGKGAGFGAQTWGRGSEAIASAIEIERRTRK